MPDNIPKGRIITVTSTVILPASATHEEIDDWVNYEGAHQGGISMDNPLIEHGWECSEIEWEDTNTYRETKISDVIKDGGYTSCRIRRLDHIDNRTAEQVECWVSPEDARRAALT